MTGKVAEIGAAIGWGALAASSLVIGALLTFARSWFLGPGRIGARLRRRALLVTLIDSMIPDARVEAGRRAGLITVLGFALAAALSSVS